MAMTYVMTDVVTDVRRTLHFCFGPPTFSMRRDRVLPSVAAFLEAFSTCSLKLG